MPIYDANVVAQIWRVDVGRVPLFLLDTERPENGPLERWITTRLYVADERTRLSQYILLGVGGVRALRALGIEPAVVHLNEGHAALAPLELAGEGLRTGESLEAALRAAKSRTVFTTHTPVPAGNDTYPGDEVQQAIGRLAEELSTSVSDVIALGRTNPEDSDQPFGVTQAALRLSRAANAVSRRHGEVAREMWHELWPDRPLDEVPIGYVTNGAHFPTWVGAPMRELLDRHLGPDWLDRAADRDMWSAVDQISDAELWEVRERQRTELVSFIRERSTEDRLARSDSLEYVEAAARAFDPDVLTIGFARRVATYKRLGLLMRDPEWTMSLLGGDRPVQVVLAGKAHPRDDEAKRTVQALFGLKQRQDHRRARGVPGRLRPRCRRPARARVRRMAEPAAPAARGERHERYEGRDQRRASGQRARRLVGRGLRRRQRLGAARRRRPRSRRSGHARRRRASPRVRRRGAARVL